MRAPAWEGHQGGRSSTCEQRDNYPTLTYTSACSQNYQPARLAVMATHLMAAQSGSFLRSLSVVQVTRYENKFNSGKCDLDLQTLNGGHRSKSHLPHLPRSTTYPVPLHLPRSTAPAPFHCKQPDGGPRFTLQCSPWPGPLCQRVKSASNDT